MALDQDAAELLAQQVLASRNDEEARDESWIRLSRAGECSRQIGYRISGAQGEADDLAALVTFEIGHAIHQRVQGWLTALGWIEPGWCEVPLLVPSARGKGTADAISRRLTKDGVPDAKGTRRVIEIKSIGNEPGTEVFGKEMELGAFDRLKEPKGHHIDQATAYAWAWNTSLAARGVMLHAGSTLAWPVDAITHLTFVYVAKDGRDRDMPLKVFTQKLSEKRTARLVGKFAAIWEALDRSELPARDFDPFGRYSPCCWCPFRAACIEGLEDGRGTDTDGEPEFGAAYPQDHGEAVET